MLWAYDGGYNRTILGGEVSRPERTLRLALVGGVSLVTLYYVGINALLLGKISYQEITASGVPFLLLLKGWGLQDWAVGLKIALSLALLATLNGTLACGPSMLSAGGLLRGEAEGQRRRGVLLFAGWCATLLLIFFLLPSRFSLFHQMSEYTACVVAGLSGLTVSCLFHLPRLGHRVGWGTRAAALSFLALDLTLMGLLAYERPGLALGGAVSLLICASALHRLRQRTADLLSAGKGG